MGRVVVIALIVIAGVVFFALGRGSAPADTASVAGLRGRWEAVKAEADRRLAAHPADTAGVIEFYRTAVVNDPAFTDTVFPALAGEEMRCIGNPAAAAAPVVSFIPSAPSPSTAVAEPPPVAFIETTPSTAPTPVDRAPAIAAVSRSEAAPAAQPRQISFIPPAPEPPADKPLSAVDQQAITLYNEALAAMEEEAYATAHILLLDLHTRYGGTAFCREHAAALFSQMARARLLAEDPELCVYFYEPFDGPIQDWEGTPSDRDPFLRSIGMLEGIRAVLRHPGVGNVRVALKPATQAGLFPIRPGQRLTLAFKTDSTEPVHIQLWDRANNADYFHDIQGMAPGAWHCVSVAVEEMRSLARPDREVGPVTGECWYMSVSIEGAAEGARLAVDEICLSGPAIPAHLARARDDQVAGRVLPDAGREFVLLTPETAEACRKVAGSAERLQVVAVAGDAMADWLLKSMLPAGCRKVGDGRVWGPRRLCAEIAERLPDMIREHHPGIIAVMAGLTDLSACPQDTPLSVSYEMIVTASLAGGAIPVLFGLPAVGDEAQVRRIAELNEALLQMSRTYRVPFIDTAGLLAPVDGHSQFAGEHSLSAEGRRKLTAAFTLLHRKLTTQFTCAR
ncbi:MAG: hypothetical protein ABIF71_05335 [Planctomycetota bacterium]